VSAHKQITLYPDHFALDLIRLGDSVVGALALDRRDRRWLKFISKATVLTTGGIGRLFRETTNPSVSTGDGMAMAHRAGAVLKDMEMVQFHPTALYLAGARRFLISEAVRGEGAQLLNASLERFMGNYDPQMELAPRDIVSKAIVSELLRTNTSTVYLDFRPIGEARILERFPKITEFCRQFGLDCVKDLVPVRPAVHYMMGGVETDAVGFTGVPRLYAAGEAACTGVHGANRLASNSLLEGLVFGKEAGRAALASQPLAPGTASSPELSFPLDKIIRQSTEIPLDVDDIRRSLTSLMWRAANVFRTAQQLRSADQMLGFWNKYSYMGAFDTPDGFELLNMLQIGGLIVKAALQREESRGAHQRTDFPETRDDLRTFHTRFKNGLGAPK
jgi:L-aspartate oxidase